MDIDNLAKFGTGFQTKAISVILTNPAFLEQIHDIIDARHFESEAHYWIVDRVSWYFSNYRTPPSMEVFKAELDKMPSNDALRTGVITALKDIYRNADSTDLQYVQDEYLTFCRNQALKNAIYKSVDKLKQGDFDGIKKVIDKAMTAGQERNVGHNWRTDIEKRLIKAARTVVPTEWDVINKIMDGGLAAGELGIVVAPAGVGKSWALCAIGKAALIRGKSVLHYTLELNENYLGLRYDTLITGFEPNMVKHHIDQVKLAIQSITGELLIKYYPTKSASVNTLRAHMERIITTGFKPDIVIVDYGDLLHGTEKSESNWQELGAIYQELRGLAGEFEVPIWTASQSQRSSVNSEIIEGDKVAESFSKIMIGDFIISISRKMGDKLGNTARIHIIKNRFGPDGITFPASVNFVEGKFAIYDENSAEGIRVKRQMQGGEEAVKQQLHKKMYDLNFSKEKDEDKE